MKSFLKFMHTLSKKLSGFNISLKHNKINQYNNIKPNFDSDYAFRIGMEDYPVSLDSIHTLQQNINSSFIYSNEVVIFV